jgi:hypothetical protein
MNESANVRLGIRIFSWSLVILVLSVLVLTFRSLKPLELRYIELMPVHLSRAESPVSIFPLVSTDDSPAVYFRYVLQVVKKLKNAGAKAVVVPIPPSTQYVPEVQSVVRRIAGYNDVVFGDLLNIPTTYPEYQDLTDTQLDDQTSWWSPHPMNHLVRMFWGLSTVRVSRTSALLRIVPYQYRESMYGYTVPDVALQVVKKYAGYSDSIAVVRHAQRVSMGAFTIPVWEDGYAYVKSSLWPYFTPFYGFVGPANDSIRYGGQWSQGRELAVTDSSWKMMDGRIVIILWPHLSSRINWRRVGYAGAYLQVINAILTNSFVHRYDQWNLAVIFLVVILAGALVFSLRTWLAVLILTGCGVAAVLVSLWLFSAHNIIFDPVYLLFTLTLCLTILPVTKVSYEKEYYRKESQRSKEEIATLESQLETVVGAGREVPGKPTLPFPKRGRE